MAPCKLFVKSFPLSIFISPVLRLTGFPLCPSQLAFRQCDYVKGLALASVSTTAVQAPIPQPDPDLRFAANPLVPCPFAFQANHTKVRCVAEQALSCVSLSLGKTLQVYVIDDSGRIMYKFISQSF